MRRVLVVALAVLVLAPLAHAADTTPVYDAKGHLIGGPYAPAPVEPRLDQKRVLASFVAVDKVADWLGRYPIRGRQTDASYDARYRSWTVKIWSGPAGEVATGRVDDATGRVTEAWTGPQVAWKMGRGYDGAFGGKKINSYPVWLGFSALFLIGLADFRRLRSWRNLDLLVLLSFSVSLWFFNRGNVLTSVPLVYPPLLYLLVRCAWIGFRGRATRTRALWPAWLLLAAAVFLMGFRIGLNAEASNVIDVGYAGVIGAERIVNGQMPYGHMPVEGTLKACGPADQDGEIRNRIQANGRCESANDRGDTYGPVAYLAYVPGYLIGGWSGKWDDLPAAHITSGIFDVLCVVGLGLVGLRFGGRDLAAVLVFAWAAYPFTQYASNSNTNDLIPPAFLIWGFWLASSPGLRGAFAALSGWTKFAPLLVAPLWLTYPERRLPGKRAFVVGFLIATALSFSILLLEPNPLHAARVFVERTVSWQVDRQSPFSIWDWRQYHAGLPDLHLLQRVLQVALVAAAIAFAFFPRRKSPLQLAALTAVLLAGFELVLTHWFYLYLPWLFPFVAFALLAPVAAEVPEVIWETRGEQPVGELVAAG